MSSHPVLYLVMLAAGVGIPILAALNAALGVRLGAPVAAAAILFAIAFSVTAVILLITGPASLRGALSSPPHLLLGGLLVAFYVLSITFIAPKIGVGNAVFFVLLGQLVSAAAIDHFGLFGATQSPLSAMRAGGIAVMGLGVWLTQLT